jgi:exosortase
MADLRRDDSRDMDQKSSASSVIPIPVGVRGAPVIALRDVIFLSLVILSIAIFWTPLRVLFQYLTQWQPEHLPSSYCLIIPLLGGALVYFERERIFTSVQYAFRAGGILLALGLTGDWFSRRATGTIGADNSLALAVLGLVIFWIGGFALCYGPQAVRAAKFALLFLALTVPFPPTLIDPPIVFVQHGSAEVASVIFGMVGVPVFRQGLFFTLPGLTVEVAKECSGIHSTMAIFIISLLAGHLTPLANWKKVFLALVIFPIVCFTNGLRIAIITLLSVYVDPRFINAGIHRNGGILFFLLGLSLLLLCFHLMRKINFPRQARAGEGK